MAKFYGKIGYVATVEMPVGSGVWREVKKEQMYYGDVLKNTRKYENGQGINDDITINNQFSIIADPYAQEHFSEMRYIEWMGTLWKISSVEIEYPRIIINIGGPYVYNGISPFASTDS